MHFRFKLNNRGIFTTERFFVLYEMMKQYGLTDVIHVENDVMVYADVGKFMSVLKDRYDLGFVRDSDKRCIASFVYIKDAKSLKPLCKHFMLAKKNVNDMDDISKYGYKAGLHYLPVVTELYTKQERMTFIHGENEEIAIKMPSVYCENIEKSGCIFDGGTYGLYVGGIDKKLDVGDARGYRVVSETQ